VGLPSPLGSPCAPSPLGVASLKSLSRVPDPYQRRRSPLLFRLRTTARPHEWLLSFPPPLSGCLALLPSPPDALLCSSLCPSASPSSLSSASPSSLGSALRSIAAAVSPSRSPACSSLRCISPARLSLRACQFLPHASSLCALLFAAQNRTRVWRPPCTIWCESDAKATISGCHGRKADAIRI
jgi:hypothetical protein